MAFKHEFQPSSGVGRLAAALARSTALVAPALIIGAAVLPAAVTFAPTVASAQDYTSGSLLASVTDDAGKAIANATIKLTSKARGQSITLTTNQQGQAFATGLVSGSYEATVKGSGFEDLTETISIVVSQESNFTFALQKPGTVKSVVVTGRRRQDFNKTATGVSLDLETLVAQQPISRNVTSLALLAPAAVKGVSGFSNNAGQDVPSLSGSSVAENAYYINGLNITNPDTYIGSAQVPFDFYKSIDVQTGGYAAEYGRATGGVINAVTKSGSNELMFAIHGNFEPDGLRSTPKDRYDFTGSQSSQSNNQVSIEAGGPLIRDHLFAYGLVQSNDLQTRRASPTDQAAYKDLSTDPFYGIKLDGYLNPSQHLEFTLFDTTTTKKETAYHYDAAANKVSDAYGHRNERTGGVNWVGKYTGQVTNWFTVSAAYGVSKDQDNLAPSNVLDYFVQQDIAGVATVISKNQPYLTHSIDQTERKFWRFDGDLNFQLAGRHHVRFGIDNEDLSETKITALNGAVPVSYRYRSGGLRITYERLGGNISAKDQAYYLQDSWDVTPNLTLQLGVRNDGLEQSNLSSQKYLDLKDNWAPRIGFNWDPTGDRTVKVFGSFGTYYIPPAMNLGFRGKDLYFREYFLAPDGSNTNFTIDPVTGLPAAIGAARSGVSGYSSDCPVDFSKAPGKPVSSPGTCTIFGGGVQDPAIAKVALGTNATHEDEYILGASWKITDRWTIGLTGTYRNLGNVSEDTDFASYLSSALGCTGDETDGACYFYNNNSAYYIWNPGSKTLTVKDWYAATQGKSQNITLTGLTFPKPKRQYQAITVDFKRAFDGKWGLQGSLTWSRSWGNYEGTVKSDAGNNAQEDAGSTQDFDYLGLTDNSTGLLPNDHRWQAKVWGSYALTDDLIVGGNFIAISPMHGSCEGYHPTDGNAAGYGASSFYCGGVASRRGTGWTSDWQIQLDMSVRYTIPSKALSYGKLVLRADVFNVLDTQNVLERYAQGDLNANFDPDPLYRKPTYYQPPRYIRLGFDWTY